MREPTYHHVDVDGLKVLAHPLRLKLLGMLRLHGPDTASGLAKRVGESSGTTSWHLRQLADARFIEEDAERGNRRERWWKAAQDYTTLTRASLPTDDPEVQDALGSYLVNILDGYRERAVEYIRTRHALPEPWRETSDISDWVLQLTPDEATELTAEVEAVVGRYLRERRPGDQPVAVQFQAFPLRTEDLS